MDPMPKVESVKFWPAVGEAIETAAATTPRRVLCVFPRYAPSLGSLEFAYGITGTSRAFMPPQGPLIIIAAALPEGWEARFVDENISCAKHSDFKWADVVFVSGMHVQRRHIDGRRRSAKRLCGNENRQSNVVFRRPYDETVGAWRACLQHAYDSARLFARYDRLMRHTFPTRRPLPRSPRRTTLKDVSRGFTMPLKVCWKLGVVADYRRIFWSFAWPRIKKGQIEDVISIGILAKHLVAYSRKARAGKLNAANYSARLR